jgi:hypothetical protein
MALLDWPPKGGTTYFGETMNLRISSANGPEDRSPFSFPQLTFRSKVLLLIKGFRDGKAPCRKNQKVPALPAA